MWGNVTGDKWNDIVINNSFQNFRNDAEEWDRSIVADPGERPTSWHIESLHDVQDHMQLWKSVHRRNPENPRHEDQGTPGCLPPLPPWNICGRGTCLVQWPPNWLGHSGDRGYCLKEDGATSESSDSHPTNTQGAAAKLRCWQIPESWNATLRTDMTSSREERRRRSSSHGDGLLTVYIQSLSESLGGAI